MILFKTGITDKVIDEVEVEKANEKSVWIKGKDWKGRDTINRQARNSRYVQYWDTLDEAKAFMHEKLTRNKETTERSLSVINRKLFELDKIK